MENIDSIRILIVEDDVFIAENIKLTLSTLGYDVLEPCTSIKTALDILDKEFVDLVIVDIQFYGKDDGIILGQKISKDYGLPFIFLTAFSDAHTVSQATLAGPCAYLIKPATPSMLYASIQTAIYNYQQQKVAHDTKLLVEEAVFFAKVNQKIIKVNWHDVECIEASKNYAILKLSGETKLSIPIRGSLMQTMQMMPKKLIYQFYQVNRSTIVNMMFVIKLSQDHLFTKNYQFELSQSNRKQLIEKLNILK